MSPTNDRVSEECREAHEHFATFPKKKMLKSTIFEAVGLGSERFLDSLTEKQIGRLNLKFRQVWIDGHKRICTWTSGSSEKCEGKRDDLTRELSKYKDRVYDMKKESWEEAQNSKKMEKQMEEKLQQAQEAYVKLREKEEKLKKKTEGEMVELKKKLQESQEVQAKSKGNEEKLQKDVLQLKKNLQQSQEVEVKLRGKEEKLKKTEGEMVELKKKLQESQEFQAKSKGNEEKLQTDVKEMEKKICAFEMLAEETMGQLMAGFKDLRDSKRKRTEDSVQSSNLPISQNCQSTELLNDTNPEEQDQQVSDELINI